MNIYQMSLSAGILILLIIVLRFVAINKLSKKIFVILWDITMLRLLLPFQIPMYLSFTKLIAMIQPDKEPITTQQNVINLPKVLGTGVTVLSGGSTNVNHESLPLLQIIWLSGALILICVFLGMYIREYKILQQALPVKDDVGIRTCLQKNSKYPNVGIMVSDRIMTPITYGILRPRIVLPKTMDIANKTQMECVLIHELVHIKRFDIVWKFLSVIAVCLHWFNPLVWVMYILYNRDLELSCDEKVISIMGEEEKQIYALALIGLAEKRRSISVLSNGFGKNAIKERITAIMKYKKMTILGVGCSVLLILASANVFAAAKTVKKSNDLPYSSATSHEDKLEDTQFNGVAYNEDTSYEELKKDNVLLTKNTLQTIKPYEPFGLSYDLGKDEMLYKNKIVRELYDEQVGIFIARNVGKTFAKDSVDLRCIYKNGKLTGLRLATEDEYNQRTEERIATSRIYETRAAEMALDLEEAKAMTYSLSQSEYFPEYEKMGLSYDAEEGTLIYKNEIVGYFKDEAKQDVYCRFIDERGTIALTTLRDKEYNLVALELVDLGEVLDSYYSAVENYIENSWDNHSNTVEEGASDSETLINYKKYGLTYDTKQKLWMYDNKKVAAVYDEGYIYLNENITSDAVYFQVKHERGKTTLKEISQKAMEKLISSEK